MKLSKWQKVVQELESGTNVAINGSVQLKQQLFKLGMPLSEANWVSLHMVSYSSVDLEVIADIIFRIYKVLSEEFGREGFREFFLVHSEFEND